jgi:tRNA dimethylallyltransferase
MTKKKKKYLIIILGPTGVGKTDLSIDIAKKYNTEIISCDSRQFYKELNIGTAVPSAEQLQDVKHHFIQHLSITDYYNVSNFEQDSLKLLEDIFKDNDIALMTGGSMMFIDAICKGIDFMPDIDIEIREELKQRLENEGLEPLRFELKRLDPDYYNEVDLKNGKRIIRALEVCYQTGKPFSSFRTKIKTKRNFNIIKIGLRIERDLLYERINKRVDLMIENGLIDEARKYYKYKHLNALNTVGYKELFDFFEEKTDLKKAIELIKRNTRRYARRQISWFNRDEEIKWFSPEVKEINNYIKDKIN